MAKYRQIFERLAEEMRNGTRPADSKLPSETELMHQFEASRGTVRKALDLLQENGYVRKHHGKGVFVLKRDRQFLRSVREHARSFYSDPRRFV